MSGIVSSDNIYWGIFLVKLDEKIEEIPQEITVFGKVRCYLRKGDRVLLYGRIFLFKNNRFSRDSIELHANNVFNETLGCGR